MLPSDVVMAQHRIKQPTPANENNQAPRIERAIPGERDSGFNPFVRWSTIKTFAIWL